MEGKETDGRKKFIATDPYNPQNTVEGYVLNNSRLPWEMAAISTKDNRYGDLLIEKVNGRPASQYVHCTPKFWYPGNRESPRAEFTAEDFPDEKFYVFEKLDGTNIFMFFYVDADGRRFTSFKTRLVPFLRAEGFKDWITMFKQAADKRPGIIDERCYRLTSPHPTNVDVSGHAFEMYGYLNEILIKYDVEIDLRYLYTVDSKGGLHHVGQGEPVAVGSGRQEALAAYNKFVAEAERLFKDGKRAEGFMFYFDDGTVYKCKPVCVVEEQSASPFIGWDDIYVTAMNAAESIDTIDELLGMTRTLLAETYDDKKIERSEQRIISMVAKAKDYLLVQREAMNVMKELGFTWSETNKATIMRAVMQRFPKNESTKIYGMLSGKKPKKGR